MSIILEGIDLPKDKDRIYLLIEGDKCFNALDPVQKLAEVIPIPTPHGRLVDIDKIKDKLKDQIPCCGLDMTYSNSNAFDTMDNAPTILEAEE